MGSVPIFLSNAIKLIYLSTELIAIHLKKSNNDLKSILTEPDDKYSTINPATTGITRPERNQPDFSRFVIEIHEFDKLGELLPAEA